MTNKQHQLAVQAAVRPKFRGRKVVKSRSVPHYPETAEREFKRITNGYIRLLKKSLVEHLPAIMDEYRREQRNDSRLDASRNLEDKVRQELQKVAEELEQKLAAFGLDGLVQKIAKLTKTNSLREWKRVCKDTLGIDLMDDYYNGDFYEEALRRWVDENISKIKSIPNETLGSMPVSYTHLVVQWVRCWDLAATEKTEDGDPAYTAGVLIGKRKNGRYVVADVINRQMSASDVRKTIKLTAQADRAAYKRVRIRLPKDPGQAGKEQMCIRDRSRSMPITTRRSVRSKLQTPAMASGGR